MTQEDRPGHPRVVPRHHRVIDIAGIPDMFLFHHLCIRSCLQLRSSPQKRVIEIAAVEHGQHAGGAMSQKACAGD